MLKSVPYGTVLIYRRAQRRSVCVNNKRNAKKHGWPSVHDGCNCAKARRPPTRLSQSCSAGRGQGRPWSRRRSFCPLLHAILQAGFVPLQGGVRVPGAQVARLLLLRARNGGASWHEHLAVLYAVRMLLWRKSKLPVNPLLLVCYMGTSFH
jgi:hypothetical protein